MANAVLAAPTVTLRNAQLDPETNTYQFTDEAMLKLICDDTKSEDAWQNLNQWAAKWTDSDMLYQSPTSSFDGIAGLTVPKFTVSNICSAIVPKVTGGLFYDDPPFLLRPRPGTTHDVIRAKTALMSYQLDAMKYEEEAGYYWEQKTLLGTGIFKWGWRSEKITTRKYVKKQNEVSIDTPTQITKVATPDSQDFDVKIDEKVIERPWIKMCDIRSEVLVDKGCRRGDIRTAKKVIYRDYATWADLERLREEPGYEIPNEDELKRFFIQVDHPDGDNLTLVMPESMRGYLQHAVPRNYPSSADPFQNGLEILERWDAEKVGVVLRYKGLDIIIRNEPNPYRKIPFYSSNWRNVPDAFYGQGIGQLVGTEQIVDQGTTALALGMLSYGLQPTAVRKKGFNAISQPTIWEQGGIIDVEGDVDKDFKFLEFPRIPAEAFAMVQQSQATAAETAGANQQTTMGAGAAGIKTTGMRSGTGAAMVGQANASRLDGPVERFIRQVFIPWLYQMDELNNERLPTSMLNDILGEELGADFKVDHEKFRNAKIEFDVLAGAHLGAKAEMARFMPFVLNLVNNPTLMELAAEQGIGFNFKAWFNQFADLAGIRWAEDLFIPLNPQQLQRRMANSPGGVARAKSQGQQTLETQKFQQNQQLLEQEQLGKAAGEAERLLIEHQLGSEEGSQDSEPFAA